MGGAPSPGPAPLDLADRAGKRGIPPGGGRLADHASTEGGAPRRGSFPPGEPMIYQLNFMKPGDWDDVLEDLGALGFGRGRISGPWSCRERPGRVTGFIRISPREKRRLDEMMPTLIGRPVGRTASLSAGLPRG